MFETLLSQFNTSPPTPPSFPVTGTDGYVTEAGLRAQAHLLINKVIEDLPDDTKYFWHFPLFGFNDTFVDHIKRASREEQAAMILALMERSQALGERGWYYHTISAQLLKRAQPDLFDTEDYAVYFSLFVRQDESNVLPFACDYALERLADHIKNKPLPDMLRQALGAFATLLA